MAGEFLEEKGYDIIEKNFRFGHHEIDIVCRDKKDLVIVEVKTVRVPEFGDGESRISKGKQRSVIRAAYAYLDRHRQFAEMGVRFDVVCINISQYPAKIIHYPGAFWQTVSRF
ncbi:MAG: YraN family protein [Calditrichales bacterium]|nr:MAG: YraN family protein [Calditrichales bacterium]